MDPWKIATAVLGLTSAAALALSLYLGAQLASTQADLSESRSRVAQAESRLKALSNRRPARQRDQARPSPRDPSTIRPSRPRSPAALQQAGEDGAESALTDRRQRMRDRWEARRQRRMERMRETLESFVEAEGLDPEVAETAISLWEDHRARMQDLRDSVVDEDLSEEEIGQRFQESRQELAEAMADLLGPDAVERLRDELPALRAGGGL